MKNNYLIIYLGIIFLLFNNCLIYSQIIYDIDDYFCLEMDVYDCLSDVLNEADVILEVTYISGEYNHFIQKTTYQVEKIFKGNVRDTIQVSTNLKEYFKLYTAHVTKAYPNTHVGAFNPNVTYIPPPKRKTHIIPLMKDSSGLIPILSGIHLMYDIYPTNPTTNTSNLVYLVIGGQKLKFKTAKDIYRFILKHNNTKFEDITCREFVKIL